MFDILVVDDDKTISFVMKEVLENNGYTVFTAQNGELKISITKYASMTNICIENNGEPIDESDYDKIFNKFYQGKSKREKEGNGIGLSIVKKIIDLHGGIISVKSQNGITAFTVNIP